LKRGKKSEKTFIRKENVHFRENEKVLIKRRPHFSKSPGKSGYFAEKRWRKKGQFGLRKKKTQPENRNAFWCQHNGHLKNGGKGFPTGTGPPGVLGKARPDVWKARGPVGNPNGTPLKQENSEHDPKWRPSKVCGGVSKPSGRLG